MVKYFEHSNRYFGMVIKAICMLCLGKEIKALIAREGKGWGKKIDSGLDAHLGQLLVRLKERAHS